MGHWLETHKGRQVAEPHFMLTIEWKAGKHCKTGEIIPTCASSQPIDKSQYCVIWWLLALALWLGVFKDKTDAQVRKILFEERRNVMRANMHL